jgi:hypothetical protein
MSEAIILRGVQVELDSDLGRAFITDATRAAESVIDDRTLMEKYELSIEELQMIANTKAVGRAIRNEREHRLRSGISTRELASGYFFKAPKVLDSIMMNEQANARHRIEAVREIRQVALPENQNNNPAQNTEKFIIRIDLTAGGGGVEHYEKEIIHTNNIDSDTPEQPKLTTPAKLTVISNEGLDDE